MSTEEKKACESSECEAGEVELLQETCRCAEHKEEIEKLKEELSAQKNIWLRTAAEYENFRKRSEKEKAAIYSDATAVAVSAILPIADSLERAQASLTDATEEYKKGISMIVSQFEDSLKKLSVESFGAVGETFDPAFHNAVAHIEDENLGENTISDVFQRGYKVGERIIRHAMVRVAN